LVSVRILPHTTHSPAKLPLYFEKYLKFFNPFSATVNFRIL
jgi:hypothetical protein